MSNMLNYIELQVKVIDLEKALEIKSKTEEYNAEIIKERKEILDKAKAKIKDFNTLITNKNYDDILLEVVRLLKSKELEPKEYSVVRMFAMEMKAMITIKDRLIAQGENCALPLASILGGLTGVVISINEKGISVLSDEHERSFLYWNTLSEQTLISLSLRLLDDKVEEDLYILGLANLRQENYEAAYRYFKKLTNIGPDDYLRYRDYLSLCETGYRLKYASKFEEIFGQIDKVSKQGNRQSAIDLLMQFKDDYLNTDLGSSYMERFKLVYNEIIRR